MNIQIRPYKNFSEAEIVELYSSVGWTAYAAAPDMLKFGTPASRNTPPARARVT